MAPPYENTQPAADRTAELEALVATLRTALHGRQVEIGHLAMENGRLQAALCRIGLEGGSFAGLRKNAWIPVANRLPDADLTVLVALADGEVWPAYLDGETWRYVDAMPIEATHVTHWRDMPEAPAGAEIAEPPAKDAGDCTTCDGTGTAFGKVCACRSSLHAPVEKVTQLQEGEE